MCAPKIPKPEPISLPPMPEPPPPPPVQLPQSDVARVKNPSTRSRRRQAGRGPSSLTIPLAQNTRPNIPN
jgi:hypothetical protein